ncbi:MAG: hypothetical protein AAFQ82_23310 [Myxococcota bacterium]
MNEPLFEHRGFAVHLCTDKRSLGEAFALRYRAYKTLDDAVQMDDELELFYDGLDFLAHTRTYLVRLDGKPVASVRSCIWSDAYDWAPNESSRYVAGDLKREFGAETRLLESNRYVVAPELQGRSSLFAQILLFKAHALASIVAECEHIITLVRPRHVRFYERMLGFRPASEPTPLSSFDCSVVLLTATRDHSLEVATSKGMPPCSADEVERFARACGGPKSENSQGETR